MPSQVPRMRFHSFSGPGVENTMPSTSSQLYAFTRVSTAQRLAGDLVFFSYGGGDISHVGIYLGGGAFIHATSNGGVKISYFDGYYSSAYVGAVRILAD